MKRIIVFVLLLIFIIGLSAASLMFLVEYTMRVRNFEEPVEIELSKGEPLSSFARDVADTGLVPHPLLFEAWVRLFSDYKSFQAGTYQIKDRYSIVSLTEDVKAGNTYEPVVFRLSIPEGFRMEQVADRLAAKKVASREKILKLCKDKKFLSSLGISSSSIEGYLYPATYALTKKPSARGILRIMVETFWEKLPEDYEERVAKKGLTLNEAVTFASLIELETHHDDERGMVSEVIWNRLERGIALAIDAAIIYGIKDYQGDIKRIHLEDSSNLYNTRKHRGLPPGPIGSPSKSSLKAVLQPTALGYFYYVVDMETGRHNFSKTLKEHNSYVQKMLRDRRRLRNQN